MLTAPDDALDEIEFVSVSDVEVVVGGEGKLRRLVCV